MTRTALWLRGGCLRRSLLWAAALILSGWLAPLPARAEGLAIDAGDFPLIRLFPDATALNTAGPAVPVVQENGLGVPGVAALDRSAPLPLRLALLVDTSGSMAHAMDAVQHAAAEAVQRLNEHDALALVSFADQVTVLTELTRNRRLLGQAVAGLRAAGGTALYDAIKAGVEQLREAGGSRRAVVVLTDGRDESAPGVPGSVTRLEPLKRLLAEAGVPVYVLAMGNQVDGAVLAEITGVSGGRVYPAASASALVGLYGDVFADLRGSGGWRYVSPDLVLDGGRRIVEVTLPGGGKVTASYRVPKVPGMLWRYTATAQPGSLCTSASLSPGGRLALAPKPLTLIHGEGRLLTLLANELAGAGGFERATVLEDGTALGAHGGGGALFTVTPADPAPGSPWSALSVQTPVGIPGVPIALSPSGSVVLRMHRPAGAQKPTFSAQRPADDGPLWEQALCPMASCDRVTGAAVADDGSALLNLTGVLQRVGADGKVSGTRKEVFFPGISFSADGTRAAAVAWRPTPKRALLMDDRLGTVAEVTVQSYLDSVPAVAAVSPDGRWFATRDDAQVQVMDTGTRKARQVPLPRLRPAATCTLPLAVDNAGRVLTGDGASLYLLQAASAAP